MLTNDDYLKIFHEIKNSITFIGSSLQMIEKQHPEIHSFHYWNESFAEVMSLRKMLLDISLLRTSANPSLSPLNLTTFMEKIQKLIAPYGETDFVCKFDISPSLPVFFTNEQMLKEAMLNLIKNAYEAMTGHGTVLIRAFAQNNSITIETTDCGGGIDASIADTIFTPYVTTKTYGTGLGLSITKHLVESMHGTLSLSSNTNVGCTFSMVFPLSN